MQACRPGHLECARWLLDQGSDVNQAKPDGTTAVTLAAQENHAELVGFLHTRSADLNRQTGAYGATALFLACQNEAVEAVQMLLDLGVSTAPMHMNNGTSSCLDMAATRGSVRLITVLLDPPGYPVEDRTQAFHMMMLPLVGSNRVDHLRAFLEHPSELSVRTIDTLNVRAAFLTRHKSPFLTASHALTLSEPCRKTTTGRRLPPSRARA